MPEFLSERWYRSMFTIVLISDSPLFIDEQQTTGMNEWRDLLILFGVQLIVTIIVFAILKKTGHIKD